MGNDALLSKEKQNLKKDNSSEQIELPENLGVPNGFHEGNLSDTDVEKMGQAEEEIQQRQMVEWKEQRKPPVDNQFEMDNKLLEIEARMARRKELMPAKDASGIERNVAIELEEEYPEIFTDDMIKGNYGEQESACIFGNGSLINAMKSIGQAKNFSFVEAAKFNKNQMHLMINISRGRMGFSAVLSKTDKHVSEGVVSHVQRQFIQRQKKKWGFF